MFTGGGGYKLQLIKPRTFWAFGVIKVKSAKKNKFLSAWCYKSHIRKKTFFINPKIRPKTEILYGKLYLKYVNKSPILSA